VFSDRLDTGIAMNEGARGANELAAARKDRELRCIDRYAVQM